MVRVTALTCLLIVCVVPLLSFVDETDAQHYSGHTVTVVRHRNVRETYCVSWFFLWGCSWHRSYWRTEYYYTSTCAPGWTHKGDYYCNTAICRPSCMHGGQCTSPNVCDCPSTSTGPFCGRLTCSYQRPCYPGDCIAGTTCQCEDKFKTTNASDGCTTFDDPSLEPYIGKSMVTLENVRRVDNRTNFKFVLDATNTNETETIWSNQRMFNKITYKMESSFDQPDGLPERPNYVHDARMGIVQSRVHGRITSIPRQGGNFHDDGEDRDLGWNETYSCNNGWSRDNPAVQTSVCNIVDDQFKTAIEHGDWMTLTFQTNSGGFMKLLNIDLASIPYGTRYYKGFEDRKQVRFKFDFRAPTHCTEPGAFDTCRDTVKAAILKVMEEFTKYPIKPRWHGWVDDLSGLWQYYVEVFKLEPNIYGQLTEATPINPEFSEVVDHHPTDLPYIEYRPPQPGMYSVLLETRDVANNSRTSRRFVLYDDESQIHVNTESDGLLHVSTAVADTGYRWQTTAANGSSVVVFCLSWDNHFVNRIHEEGKLLNEILPYPVQFKDIQDDGILFSKKYVNASLDAPVNYLPGRRTRAAIPNFHGIVKFETAHILQETDDPPRDHQWTSVTPLAEERNITLQLDDGDVVRLWVRATDVMGNTAQDKTTVGVDRSPPVISQGFGDGYKHEWNQNVNGTYIFSSNVKVATSDPQSGVYRIDLRIWVTIKGVRTMHEHWSENATRGHPGSPNCQTVIGGECFIAQQSIDINNCHFMVNKTDLDHATAELEVSGLNQAMLETSTFFSVGHVNELKGLEKYSGPRNIHIVNPTPNGFRVKWDLPENPSCYGIADIVILLVKTDAYGNQETEAYMTQGTATHFDILGLNPETQYALQFSVKGIGDASVNLMARTAPDVETNDFPVGGTVGIIMALVVVFGITIAALFVLMRRGVIHPRERARQIRRAVTVKARTIRQRGPAGQRGFQNASYNNRQSDLYIYGGVDMDGSSAWQLDRDDVVFESQLKSGHFANIYTGKLRGNKSQVVLKTLKEHFSAEDEILMRAKMNFTGKVVGDHPHVLRFLGGVVSDVNMGPFILYEYCENGTLHDFLVASRNNVTMELQENLFRFGYQISKGMEYLAQKSIVHRRLAARNILLTATHEVKIYGFGPQPSEENDEDAESGRKERIPIKWMAPECMASTKDATERSDVWSFGIVLWEVFSLGETPFDNVRSRELASKVKKGDRLVRPEQCDDTWYNIMTRCWAYEARKRPRFSELRQELEGMFVSPAGDDHYYYQR